MPSEPRAKPLNVADPAPKTHEQAAEKARQDGLEIPEGATVGKPPAEGLWDALVDAEGEPVLIDGNPVRVPIG
jgi:hypothetical protein